MKTTYRLHARAGTTPPGVWACGGVGGEMEGRGMVPWPLYSTGTEVLRYVPRPRLGARRCRQVGNWDEFGAKGGRVAVGALARRKGLIPGQKALAAGVSAPEMPEGGRGKTCALVRRGAAASPERLARTTSHTGLSPKRHHSRPVIFKRCPDKISLYSFF